MVGSLAHAQSKSTSEGEASLSKMAIDLKKECKSDIEKLCKGVTPGEGRIASCLDSKEDQLSQSCGNSWMGTKANVSKRVEKAEMAFRKSCGNDLQKFCSDVPLGRGRLLSCLDSHREDLSSSCTNFYSSLDQRLSKLVG